MMMEEHKGVVSGGSIMVVGFGTPEEPDSLRVEQSGRLFLRAFRQVFSVLYPEHEQPVLILIGPRGVIETHTESVVEGQSSIVAVQSLLRQHKGKGKKEVNVYCFELTKDTPSLLPWRMGFRKVQVLSFYFAVTGVLTPIENSTAPPANSEMGKQWNRIMAKRLAHEETIN